jgi:hypothetical protein
MRRARRQVPMHAAVVACSCLFAAPGFSADWELSLDLRALSSDGRDSFLDNGLGKLRFDDDDDGLRLGPACAPPGTSRWAKPSPRTSRPRPGTTMTRIPSTSPRPTSNTARIRAPAGARGCGWAPSIHRCPLESRAIGWESPYTITPSAISSWIGEEIRTIGPRGAGRLAGYPARTLLRFPGDWRSVRLERPGRNHARHARLCAA